MVLAVVRAGVSSLCPPSAWWASVHLCLVAFSKPSARSVPECGTDRAEGDTATLLTVPPDERPSAASSGVWRRDGAHVRRGAKLRRRSAVGGSCPPSYAWLGLVARRPGVACALALASLIPTSRLPGRTPAAAERRREKGALGQDEPLFLATL